MIGKIGRRFSEKIMLHENRDTVADRQRIDRWLWHARIVRTRDDAAALAGAGCSNVRCSGILFFFLRTPQLAFQQG